MPSIFWLRAKIPNSILRQKLPVKGIKKQDLGFLELGGKYSFKNDRIWFSMGLARRDNSPVLDKKRVLIPGAHEHSTTLKPPFSPSRCSLYTHSMAVITEEGLLSHTYLL